MDTISVVLYLTLNVGERHPEYSSTKPTKNRVNKSLLLIQEEIGIAFSPRMTSLMLTTDIYYIENRINEFTALKLLLSLL